MDGARRRYTSKSSYFALYVRLRGQLSISTLDFIASPKLFNCAVQSEGSGYRGLC